GLFLLAIGAALIFSATRQMLQPRPYLRLDEDGFECPLGGAQWSDVARIGVYQRRGEHGDTEMLLMILSPGSVMRPSPRSYGIVGDKNLTEQGPALDFWADRAHVRGTLRSYYDGPIDIKS